MKRLLDHFAELFDLDYRIGGARIGELIERAVVDLDEHTHPDWGAQGPAASVQEAGSDRFVRFYYRPHLFPGMELDLRLAHKLQFHLLPRDVPPEAPVTIAAVLESYCHLSGDLFGWEMLADGKFLVWIVDVSGHGVQSGLASATLSVIIDNLHDRSHVEALVGQLNDALNRCARSDSLYATGFFMAVDADGSASYTSAGHPAVLVRDGDRKLHELKSNSRPIGMLPDQRYAVDETCLAPGDTLLLYTDGVLEGTDRAGQEFGIARLRDILQNARGRPEELTGALYRAIAGHQDMAKLDDDVTFLAMRMAHG